MSDDIDIDEHDLLQHPRIINMFPDLSRVKQEVQDIEENECGAAEYDSNMTIKQEPIDMQSSSPPWGANVSFSNNREEYHSFPTKIILGSKPSRPREIHPSLTNDNLNAFVLVEDWGSILEASACFCNICKTLFPTENALDAHKMAVHSFLVAIDSAPRNVAVKSTSKTVKPTRNMAKKSTATNKPPVGKLCNHCHVFFADDNALVKHLYELLPVTTYPCDECNEIFDTKEELVAHSAVHNLKVEAVSDDRALYYVCSVCKCSYKYLNSFTNHMIHNHGVEHFEKIKSEYTGGCQTCPRRSISRTKCNEHIKLHHNTLFQMKISTNKPNKLSGVVKNEPIPKFIKPNDSVTSVPRNIPRSNNDSTSGTNSVAGEAPTISYVLTRSRTIVDPPVPVSGLFKCRSCSFHFLSCYAAEPHAQRCSAASGDSWKCHICKRIFKQTDRALHLLQHEYVDKFQIYLLPAKLLTRLLSECPRCRVHFDEWRFWEHWQAGCRGRSDAYRCAVCALDVSLSCRVAHVRKHKHNFTRKTFIILKYVSADRRGDKNKVTEVLTENGASSVTLKRKFSDSDRDGDVGTMPVKRIKLEPSAVMKKKKFIYCSVCECYMIRASLHSTAECAHAKKQVCTFCGLTFTRTVIGSHFSVNHFNNKSFKITDAVYFSLEDGKRIAPPVPSYFTCKGCKVCFSSAMYLRHHNCGEEACRHCAVCNRNYTPTAFKLHMNFHRYTRPKKPVSTPGPQLPDLIKNYEAIQKMWDILYLCVTCNVVTDSYDQVIDHCQSHYNCEEGLNVDARTCKKCNLKFHTEVFAKHTELHARNEKITKATFSIVGYDYKNFTSDDDWLRNFRNLPESQFRQILNRSIYAPSRFLKMEMIQNGAPALTIYKCEYCSHHVHSNSVNRHKSDCEGYNIDYNYCESCDIRFASLTDMDNHEKSHKTSLADKYDFRIVAFNNILFHDYDKTLKRVLGNKIGNDGDERLAAFVCTSCKAFVQHKYNTRYHSCSPASYLEICPMCKLHVKKNTRAVHQAYHNKNPGFVKGNIKVITFKPRSLKVANEKTSKSYTVPAKKRLVEIYRCACGLHFASMNSIKRHFEVCKPGYDVSKETCSKCNYLFPTSDLVSHLCNHHNEQKPTRLQVVDLSNKTVTAYKCDKCKLLFCERAAAVAHYGECAPGGELGERCDRCNLMFHPKMMPVHRDIHKINESFSNHIVTINKMHVSKSPVHSLYKCGQCELHFIKRDSLQKHMKHTPKHGLKFSVQRCEICNLRFNKLVMKKHMRLHHKLMKPAFFYIVEFNGNEQPLNYLSQEKVQTNLTDVTSDGEVSLSRLKKTLVGDNPILCKILSKTNDSVEKNRAVLDKNKKDAEQDDRVLDGINEKPNFNVCTRSNGEKYYLFKCVHCSLNFVNSSTIRTHMRTGNHGQASVTCSQCGLDFNEFSLPRHEELHHGNISREIVVLKSTKAYKNNADVLCAEDSIIISENDLNDARRMRELERDANSNININYTYKCGICLIHYNKLRVLKMHIKAGRHDEDADFIYPCPECGFIFSAMSLENHIESCHRRMNFKRENMKVVTFLSNLNDDGESKLARNFKETSSTHYVNGEQSIDTDVNSFAYKSEDGTQYDKALKIKYKSHDKSTIDSAAEVNGTKSSSVKHRIQFEDEIAQHESAAVSVEINKKGGVTFTDCLFLCPTCDMPFLKARSLLYHLKNNKHDVNVLLDCDVCGLKFTEKTMPHHRRLHHDLLNIKKFRFVKNCVENDEMNEFDIVNVLVRVEEIEETVNRARKNGKHVLFKCSECPEHHSDVDTVKQHIASGSHDVNLIECYPCPGCGLAFKLPDLDTHIEEDHEVSNNENDDFYVVTVQADVIPKIPKVNSSRRRNQSVVQETKVEIKKVKNLFKGTPVNPAEYNEYLYQCNKCPLNFIKYSSLHRHMARGLHDIVSNTCDLCGHVFSDVSLSRHKYVHHEVNGIDHFLIWKLLSESDLEVNQSENSLNVSSLDESQTNVSNLSVHGSDNNVLYKCHRCPGYFINRNALMNHLERHNNSFLLKCPECDYNFKCNAIENHIRLHHKKLKLKHGDFIIVTPKSGNDNTVYLDDISMDNPDTKERVNDSVLNIHSDLNETDTNAMMEDSDLNETNANGEIKADTNSENAIEVSDLNGKHNDKSENVIEVSNLNGRHNEKRENVIEVSDLNGKHNDKSENVIEVSNLNGRHNDKRENVIEVSDLNGKHNDKSENVIEVSNLNGRHNDKRENVIEVSDLNGKHNDKRENVMEVSDLNRKHSDKYEIDAEEKDSLEASESHKVTLYKCAECKVYYLNQRARYEHTTNHMSLDPIDYIECKFCNLQFTLLSLEEHLKKHHNNVELRLEDIAVEEHKVRNGADKLPVISIYSASDRFQSLNTLAILLDGLNRLKD